MSGRVVSGAVMLVAAAGCGYPSFDFAPAGSGGSTSASSTASSSSTVSSSASASSTSSSAGGGSSASSSVSSSSGAPPCPTHIVIAEVRSRGAAGGSDEFVTLYNPTAQAIILSPDWSLLGQSNTDFSPGIKWQGSGGILPAHGYFLLGGSGYTESPSPDESLGGITDASILQLVNINQSDPVDVVCYAYDAVSSAEIAAYGCPGMPAANPHDGTQGSNADRSIARTPLDCTDTGDNSVDFGPRTPATPKSSTSPPQVY